MYAFQYYSYLQPLFRGQSYPRTRGVDASETRVQAPHEPTGIKLYEHTALYVWAVGGRWVGVTYDTKEPQ